MYLPYRHGLRCGDLVFLGGQVPLPPDAAVPAPGDMVAQTRISMDYIGRILGEFGFGFGDVVKVEAFYLGDVGHHGQVGLEWVGTRVMGPSLA